MSNRIFMAAIVLFFCFAPSEGRAVEGYPGSTWGELRWENTRHGQDNLLLNGWVEQGVDWVRWGGVRLNTYGTIRYKWDSEGLDWNNSVGPGVGVALTGVDSGGDQIKVGIEYIWDSFYESGRTEEKAVLFMKWYGWWDIKGK